MLSSEELATCAAAILSSVSGANPDVMQQRNALAEKLLQLSRAMAEPVPVRRYFIQCTDANGESLDWFIDATTPADALRRWRDNPSFDVRGMLNGPERIRVFTLPAGPFEARVIDWHEPFGVTEVYDILADKLPSVG